jgi:hypothetical protein
MDKVLGSVIDDYTLYRIMGGLIIILTLVAVYIAIQISLIWNFLNKKEANSDELISNKKRFYKSSIFIFIAGFFMVIHEFLESLVNAPDYSTNKFFEFIAFLGLVLFMFEWYKILKELKKKQTSRD